MLLQAEKWSHALSPKGIIIGYHVLDVWDHLRWVDVDQAECLWKDGAGTNAAPCSPDPEG